MNIRILRNKSLKRIVISIYGILMLGACNNNQTDNPASILDDQFSNVPTRDSIPNNYYLEGDTLIIMDLIDTNFVHFTNDTCHPSFQNDCIRKSDIKFVYDIYGWTTAIAQNTSFSTKEGRLFYERDGLLFQQFYDQITVPRNHSQHITIDNIRISFGIETCRGEDFLRFAEVTEISDSTLFFLKNTHIEIDSSAILSRSQKGSLEFQPADEWTLGHFKFVRTLEDNN